MKKRIVRVIFYAQDGTIQDICEWQDGTNGIPDRTSRGGFYNCQQSVFDQAIKHAASGCKVLIEAKDEEV